MGNTLSVTNETFENEVLKSPVPVLVDFWAAWCSPCKAVAPIVDQLATEFAGKLKVVKVNVDDSEDIAIRYNIRSIPTLIVYKGGQEVERLIGAYPKAAVLSKVTPHL